MTPTKDQVRVAAAGQAAEWFIANQAPAPDHARRAAFVAWLKASPIHIEEYLGVALVAHDLRLAADDSDEAISSLLELARADAAGRVVSVRPLRRSRASTGRYWAGRRWSMAAAVILAAACIAWWIDSRSPGLVPQRFATHHGEQSVQHLADGSSVHLNADTTLQVRYDRHDRLAQLEAGQAFFTVSHGDARRFRVTAGAAEIVAIGTRFDVRLQQASTVVTVVEGEVEVRTTATQGGNSVASMRVSAGHRLGIDGGNLPAQSDPVDTDAAIAWLQHTLAFEGRPLGDVADEFNRYGVVQILIEDKALRALPISGVFNAYDTNSFAAFLESLDGVRVERSPEKVRVMRQETAQPRDVPSGQ